MQFPRIRLSVKGTAGCRIVVTQMQQPILKKCLCLRKPFPYSPRVVREIDERSFEPYTCKVAILLVRSGKITLSSFGVRTYEHDRTRFIERKIRDPELANIYKAAGSTFVHNAVDLYTDCPSRERAGWLCDTYFTSGAEYFLTEKTTVEDAFLENYRLYESDGVLPGGALPMCYPADIKDGNEFIPQWDMRYVLEVKEYLAERNMAVDTEKESFGQFCLELSFL